VQAHTVGTVLSRAYSGTILPIFTEIGSYLTDMEQKISWHIFFETQCILLVTNLIHRGIRFSMFTHATSHEEDAAL